MPEDLHRPDQRPLGAPVAPRRGPRWSIVVALVLVAVLGAWFAWKWPTSDEMSRAVDPEAHGRAVGTSGERVPGATGAPNASEVGKDSPLFPMPANFQPGTVVAFMDKQPLHLVGTGPESIPDTDMSPEGPTEEGKVGGGYHLYVPKDYASGQEVSARYYYLRTGPNQYIKVSHRRENP